MKTQTNQAEEGKKILTLSYIEDLLIISENEKQAGIEALDESDKADKHKAYMAFLQEQAEGGMI